MRSATGVGVVLNRAIPDFLASHPDAVDYVEVIPETLWTDRRRKTEPRFEWITTAVADVEMLAATYPLASHGVGLSVGSALPLDERHLTEVCRFLDRFGVARYSEHLGFNRVPGEDGVDHHIGLGFPVPCDYDVLDLMTERVARVIQLTNRAVILENGVCHTPLIDEDMSEPAFINQLASRTGCGVLLDLHNLYTNYRNNGQLPQDYIHQLELECVREIHIAGGSMIGSAYTDSHAGVCPPEVWELLVDTVPKCPNLEGVTFEFHDSYYPSMGEEGLLQQLSRARDVWRNGVA
ncbi:MAG: DUF692 family multinuclear iron-containing protein [Sedimenticolaceae bacterium]